MAKSKLPATLDQKTTEEKAHAVFGASSSDRWLNCPGSIALSEKAPPEAESPYAAEGTYAHACLEFLLRNRNDLQTAKEAARHRFTDEMVAHALDAVEYIQARHAELDNPDLLIETKIDASSFTMTGQFGTLDVALAEDFGRLIVMDYKYGAGHAVELTDEDGRVNSQLAYYALGISTLFGHWFDSVELVVIQPRAFHEAGPIRTHTMTIDELKAWHRVFRDGVMESSDPKAPLRSGRWCKWCPARVICPKLKDEGFRDAQVVFKDEVGVLAVPEPSLIKLPHLGTILDGVERLEIWVKAVKAHAYGVLERGGTIPGYKLVERRATRKWASEGTAAAAFCDVPGAFSAPKLKSPAQMIEALKKSGESLKNATSLVTDFTVKESSGRQLVKGNDKRDAVVSGASAVFSEVSDLDFLDV